MQTKRYREFRVTPSTEKKIIEIVDKRIREVHVTKEDFSELKNIVGELAEAQKRTEVKIEELAEAQKRTEVKVEELAEIQKRTEAELKELVGEHKETRKQLGGLSGTVGYGLEDKSYIALPNLLKRDFKIEIEGKLKRQYVKDKEGQNIEVNIVGNAIKNGKKVKIIGEGKTQLSINDINDFIRKKLKRLEGIYEEIVPIMVTYMITQPEAEEYAKGKGIILYYSYDF